MTRIKIDVLDFINTLSDKQKAHVWHELNWSMWPTCIPTEMQPRWWNLKEVQMVKIEYAGR